MTKIYNILIKWPLYALAFLLPIFFLPWTLNVLDYNKQSIMLALVGISLFAWLIKSFVSGSATISFNPFSVLVVLFLAVYGLASFLSIYNYGSIWGASQGLVTIAAFCVFYFLIISAFSAREAINMLRLFALSGFLALLYGILQLCGKFIFKFPFSQNANFNTIGSVNELGIFAAVFFPLAVMLIYSSKRVMKGLFIALIASEVIILMLVNFKFAWLSVAVGAALVIILGMQKRSQAGGNKLIIPMFVFAASLILFFFNFQMPSFFSRTVEVYLNQKSSIDVSLNVLKEGPVLGSGPETFAYDFAKFKKVEFNNTFLWNATFENAGSKIINILAETGVLGIISFLMLMADFLFYGLFFSLDKRNAIEAKAQETASADNESDKNIWLIGIGAFASFAALLVSYFFYNSSLALDFFLFLLIACISVFLYPNKKEVVLKNSSISTLVLTFSLMVVFIANFGILISGVQKYIAEVYYFDAVKEYSAGNIDSGMAKAEKALSINQKSDIFSRNLSQIYLVKLNDELKRKDIPVAQVSQNVQKLVQLATISAQRATDLNPADSANWSVKGYIYQNLISLYIGFDEQAISAYEEAIKIEPTNPYYPTQEGIVYLAAASQLKESQKADKEKKLSDAEAKFKRVIELKADYASAMYQLAITYQAQGKTDEAIGEFKNAEAAAPYDVGLIFQLGLFYYNINEYGEARQEFEKAVNINPQYSNAIYFLGLTYDKLGKKDKAVEMIEKVLALNPDNEEVKKVLDNLKNGRGALDGLSVAAPSSVTEKPSEIQDIPQAPNQSETPTPSPSPK